MAIIIGTLTVGATRRRLAWFTLLIGNYNNIIFTIPLLYIHFLRYIYATLYINFLHLFLLLTAESLINAVYVRISSVTRDTSANGNIVNNLAIGIGTTRTRTWILTF